LVRLIGGTKLPKRKGVRNLGKGRPLSLAVRRRNENSTHPVRFKKPASVLAGTDGAV